MHTTDARSLWGPHEVNLDPIDSESARNLDRLDLTRAT